MILNTNFQSLPIDLTCARASTLDTHGPDPSGSVNRIGYEKEQVTEPRNFVKLEIVNTISYTAHTYPHSQASRS